MEKGDLIHKENSWTDRYYNRYRTALLLNKHG